MNNVRKRERLSFAQQSLWCLEQINPGLPLYNNSVAIRLNGFLDVPALKQSVAAIVRRHDALRTYFINDGSEPAQVIVSDYVLQVGMVDLGELPEAEREDREAAVARAEAGHVFQLEKLPLFRITLVRLAPETHALVLVMHHIVSDGWSLDVFVQELAAFYSSFLLDQPARVADLPIQYADYSLWQRKTLTPDRMRVEVAHWKARLEGAPKFTSLPLDRPRPAVQSYRGAKQCIEVGRDLSEAALELGRREGVTLFMLLLAAFKVLLYARSGQSDVVVGAGVANRQPPETEQLIGFFINLVALRTSLAGNPTFREFLSRVRAVTLDAYEHQQVPFEQVLEELRPERGLGHAPLLQVLFDLQNTPAHRFEMPGLKTEMRAIATFVARYDLTILLWNTDDGLKGTVEYNTDILNDDTVAQLVRDYKDLLAAVVRSPQERIDSLAGGRPAPDGGIKRAASGQPRLTALAKFKPAPVRIATNDVATVVPPADSAGIPLEIRAAMKDVDLVEWISAHRSFIGEALRKNGAILFRGFPMASPAAFERIAVELCGQLLKENGEHTPVTSNGNVQTPVFYSPSRKLIWHNENSFNYSWPKRILFECAKAARQGGQTPIVDSRKVFSMMPADIRDRFARSQLTYIRNYAEGPGLSWRQVFRTDDRKQVEAQCEAEFLRYRWKGPDRLTTWATRPAVIPHPETGEMSWFNQAQHWHPSCLDAETRAALHSAYAPEDRPRDCRLGDGSVIEDEIMTAILDIYAKLEIVFDWLEGDLLLLDNVLTAHARNPYVGERQILVAMGDMGTYALPRKVAGTA